MIHSFGLSKELSESFSNDCFYHPWRGKEALHSWPLGSEIVSCSGQWLAVACVGGRTLTLALGEASDLGSILGLPPGPKLRGQWKCGVG